MRRFAFVLLILVSFEESCSDCPSNVVCKSTLNQRSCPEGQYFREKKKSQNCCPDCVLLKEMNADCEADEECASGLYCEESMIPLRKICQLDERQKCDYYKRTDPVWLRTKYWLPDCLPNGKYSPKQCKGEKLSGKCFCTNENGERIFGEVPWMDAENMTCACSRQAEILQQSQKDLSVHCDDYGNYEALQCNNGVCWCANERNGKPFTPVVPESMTRVLPCFEENSFGSQYLRKCDSIRVHTERIIKILKNHGMKDIILQKVNCDYDGSYARVQSKGNMKSCVYKNEILLRNPTAGVTDCNCVYDEFVMKNVYEKIFNFECSDSGSYKTQQALGDSAFKVDSDGFMYEILRNKQVHQHSDYTGKRFVSPL